MEDERARKLDALDKAVESVPAGVLVRGGIYAPEVAMALGYRILINAYSSMMDRVSIAAMEQAEARKEARKAARG